MTPTTRDAIAQAIAALEQAKATHYDCEDYIENDEGAGWSCNKGVREEHCLCLDWIHGIQKASSVLASLRLLAPAPADQSDAGRNAVIEAAKIVDALAVHHRSTENDLDENGDTTYYSHGELHHEAAVELEACAAAIRTLTAAPAEIVTENDTPASTFRSILTNALWEFKKSFSRGTPFPQIVIDVENALWGWRMPSTPGEDITFTSDVAPAETVGRGETPMTLIEKLRNPAWETDGPFKDAKLNVKMTWATMQEAADKLEKLALPAADREAIREAVKNDLSFFSDMAKSRENNGYPVTRDLQLRIAQTTAALALIGEG